MKAQQIKPEQQRHRPQRKSALVRVRMEQGLAERLRCAAIASEISASDKVRRILDQVLPQTP